MTIGTEQNAMPLGGEPQVSPPQKSYLFFLMFLVTFEFGVYVSNDMILPALKQVFENFHVPLKNIPLSMTYFMMGAVLLQLFVGPMSDRYGRRATMFGGSFVTIIGNFLGAVAPTLTVFYVARALQGMGLCFITVAGYACVHEIFDTKQAVRSTAWMASVGLLAPMMGPFLGSLVLLVGHWQHIFWITFFLTFASSVGLYFTMPESLPEHARESLHVKKQIKNYWRLIKNNAYFYGSLSYSFVFGALMIWISSSPLLLMKEGVTPQHFGIIQMPIFLSFIVGTYFLRLLTKRYTVLKCYNIGFGLLFVSALIILVTSFFHYQSVIPTIVIMAIYNFGYGVMGSPNYRLLLESTDVLKGSATAFSGFVIFVFGALCPWLFSLVYDGTQFQFLAMIAVLIIVGCIGRVSLVRFEDKEAVG